MVTRVNDTQRPIPEFLNGRIHSRPNLERQETPHNVSMDTTPPTPESSMLEIFQKLLSNGLDTNKAAQCAYCKATNHFNKSCPKLKKKRKMEDKIGKKLQRPTYPECLSCSKTNHTAAKMLERPRCASTSHEEKTKNKTFPQTRRRGVPQYQ